ncbi:hypothetical protein LTR64_008758 [Lithohypha guttulata]|uniref:uncharacterized protein n=1 Tax=Lithohypha guttulata TaxID=1690604 RepID=UPI00315C999B
METRTESPRGQRFVSPTPIVKQRPTYEQRLLELLEEVSDLKREVMFYRAIQDSTEDIIQGLHGVTQEMILNYYIRPNGQGEGDTAWLECAEKVSASTMRHAQRIKQAEVEWKDKQECRSRLQVRSLSSGLY